MESLHLLGPLQRQPAYRSSGYIEYLELGCSSFKSRKRGPFNLNQTYHIFIMTQSPLPTYEDLRASRTPAKATTDFFRLRWFLQSDNLSDSITIIQDAANHKSPQDAYTSTHPVLQAALTNPPVSAITVSVPILDDFDKDWRNLHSEHADTVEGSRLDAENVVEYCCGQDSPGPAPCVKVEAKPGHFSTIGQFVDVVHPWLQGLVSTVHAAWGMWDEGPLDHSVKLFIYPTRPSPLPVITTRWWTPETFEHNWEIIAKASRRSGGFV